MGPIGLRGDHNELAEWQYQMVLLGEYSPPRRGRSTTAGNFPSTYCSPLRMEHGRGEGRQTAAPNLHEMFSLWPARVSSVRMLSTSPRTSRESTRSP
ncbi:hypothetical protein E2320_014581 [Naja naja]|nr:hypothetical protein E2320_014581 [Naja naja]